MSTLKVDGIRSNSASSDAITMADNGTCTANVTNNLSNRNIIINGAMQICQRPQSSSGISSSNYYSCDRQKTQASYGGTWTVSQSTEAPSDNGFTKSLKYDCTGTVTPSANSYLQHYYRVEGHDLQGVRKGTSNAKPLILSFWVKTNKTGTYNVEAIDQDNSRLSTFSYTVGNTNWNKYTIVFPADTTGAFGDDNGASLDIGWWLVAGSTFNTGSNQNAFGTFVQANRAPSNVNLADSTSNEWYITGIQLEIDHTGSGVATDFEHRSYPEELRRCQRYFYMHAHGAYVYSPNTPDSTPMGTATKYTITSFYGIIYYPVQMRAHPSFYKSLGTDRLLFFAGASSQGFNDVANQDFGINGSIVNYYDSLNSSEAAGWVQLNNNNAYVGFNAEL